MLWQSNLRFFGRFRSLQFWNKKKSRVTLELKLKTVKHLSTKMSLMHWELLISYTQYWEHCTLTYIFYLIFLDWIVCTRCYISKSNLFLINYSIWYLNFSFLIIWLEELSSTKIAAVYHFRNTRSHMTAVPKYTLLNIGFFKAWGWLSA